MKTKLSLALGQKLELKKTAAQRLMSDVLPAGRLDGGWAIELAFAEQSKNQSHQFSGSKHDSAFMFVFGNLRIFRFVVSAISGVVHSQRISGFHEVVAQVGVCRAKQSS